MSFSKYLFAVLVLTLTLGACKKANDSDEESVSDDVANVVDSAIGEVSEQAGAIVTSGFFETQSVGPSPSAACAYSTARSSCSSSSITIDWNGCTIGSSSATFAGEITERFSGTGSGSCILGGDNARLDRLVSNADPRTITLASGAKIVSDMSPENAWDGTTFPTAGSTSVTRLQTGSSNGITCGTTATTACYNIVVRGNQTVMTGPRGRKWFDHIVTANLTAKGRKSTADMFVSGTTSVWHQVSSYKAVHSFGSVTWGSSSCCYPTAGSISTALTGSVSGNATTVFSSTCGQASFTGVDNTTKTVTFNQCQP